jgi:hypothetical protein
MFPILMYHRAMFVKKKLAYRFKLPNHSTGWNHDAVRDLVRNSLISGSEPRVHHIILFTAILCQVEVFVSGLLRRKQQQNI